MSDSLIRGLLTGAVILIIFVVISGVLKVARSEAEGARRMRTLFKVVGLAGAVTLVLNASPADKPMLLALLLLAGAGWWVYKGYKGK